MQLPYFSVDVKKPAFLDQWQRVLVYCLLLIVAGCGGGETDGRVPAAAEGSFGIEDISPSAVDGVMLSTDSIVVTFTKPPRAETVSSQTAGIWSEAGQRELPSTLSLEGRRVTITPSQQLTPGAAYTFVITDEVRSNAGERFAGLIARYTVDGFEMLRSSVKDDAVDFHVDGTILLGFSEPVMVDSLREHLVLFDTTTASPIPYLAEAVNTSGRQSETALEVRIRPVGRLPGGHTIELRAGSGIMNTSGERLPPAMRTFTVSDKHFAPVVQDFFPGPDEQIDPYDSIVITFSQDIDPASVDEDDGFLRKDNRWVKTKTTVDGPRVIITPVEPLSYRARYVFTTVLSDSSTFKDEAGVPLATPITRDIDTGRPEDELLLEFTPEFYAADPDHTALFFYSPDEKQVAKVNLPAFDRVEYLELEKGLQSACVNDTHLYVLTKLGETGTNVRWHLGEYDRHSLLETNSTSFRQDSDHRGTDEEEWLHCIEDSVFFQSYRFFYELNIAAPEGEDLTVFHEFDKDVNRITQSEEGVLFYPSNALYRLDGREVIKVMDLHTQYNWRSSQGTLQASIDRNLLASNNAIYRLDTGEEIIRLSLNYTWDDNYVFAVDYQNMHWFDGESIYSLEDNSSIGSVEQRRGYISFFDPYGNLYYSGIKRLFRVEHDVITSGALRE